MNKEFTDINLAILVNVLLMVSTVIGGVFEDFIHILMFIWITFQSELKESWVQIKSIFDFVAIRLFC